MAARRIFVPALKEKDAVWLPDAPALSYVTRVLRSEEGARFEGFGPDGTTYALSWVSPREGFRVLDKAEPPQKEGVRIALGVGLPKGPKFEQILRPCTEAGVDAFFPVHCERSVVHLDAGKGDAKRARWEKVLQEASRQSGRPDVPYLEAPLSWGGLLGRLGAFDLVLMPHPGAQMCLRHALGGNPGVRSLLILTGPEGGWSPREIEESQARGAKGVKLPVPVLRAETAPLATVAMVRYHLSLND